MFRWLVFGISFEHRLHTLTIIILLSTTPYVSIQFDDAIQLIRRVRNEEHVLQAHSVRQCTASAIQENRQLELSRRTDLSRRV